MKTTFYKYQGAGNDFILIDNRTNYFGKNKENINKLCDRNFGIGSDGLILLENDETYDFKMLYYNSDGNESTMCGNGGRCIVAFAHKLNLFKNKTIFNAVDGLHKASIEGKFISLQMIDVNKIDINNKYCYLNTGSPHHVELVKNISSFNVFSEGRKIREEIYGTEGANVNFVEQINSDTFKIRTYERGVENETLACGTGATAVAIAMHKIKKTNSNTVKILTEGGELSVSFNKQYDHYNNVYLKGEAKFVFSGNVEI